MIENIAESVRLVERGALAIGAENWTSVYPNIFSRISLPEGRILDVGSYDSRFARWFNTNGTTRNVVSLDIRDLSYHHFEFVRGNASVLPFKDKSFDEAVSFGAFPLNRYSKVPLDEVFNEMLRVTSKRVTVWPVTDILVPPFLSPVAKDVLNGEITDRVLDYLDNPMGIKLETLDIFEDEKAPNTGLFKMLIFQHQ